LCDVQSGNSLQIMKKTTTKTSTKTVAPKAAAKPAAAKVAAPKKTVSVKKAAPAPVASAKPAKVTTVAKVPAPKVKSVPVTTTIVAAVDVGFGNNLTLRGEGPGLSWEVGVPLECTADDRWSITLPATTHPIICKFLINDISWSLGEDYTVLPGSSVVLSPVF
jgi:hypothetical protein